MQLLQLSNPNGAEVIKFEFLFSEHTQKLLWSFLTNKQMVNMNPSDLAPIDACLQLGCRLLCRRWQLGWNPTGLWSLAGGRTWWQAFSEGGWCFLQILERWMFDERCVGLIRELLRLLLPSPTGWRSSSLFRLTSPTGTVKSFILLPSQLFSGKESKSSD